MQKVYKVGCVDSGYSSRMADVYVTVEARQRTEHHIDAMTHQEIDGPVTELSFTFDEYRPGARDVDACGAGVPDIISRITSWHEGWDMPLGAELATLAAAWHLNDMEAACAHMTPVPTGSALGFPDMVRGEIVPCLHVKPYVQSGREVESHSLDHYGANRVLECAAGTGYRYGRAWLTRIPPESIVKRALSYPVCQNVPAVVRRPEFVPSS